jgi:hypothetical protein
MGWLAEMLRRGEGCAKNWRQAALWAAKAAAAPRTCDLILEDARLALKRGKTKSLDCDFNQLCYSLGWGLYWYHYGSTKEWTDCSEEDKAFGTRCLNFYCCCVELQQKSIYTFLLFWNRTVGVKDVGVMMGKLVWEGREENLLQGFEGRSE